MSILSGIVPALLTPFTKQNQINTEALRELTGVLLNKGVSGFYVSGSTSEAFLMTPEERLTVLKTAVEQVNRRKPVIFHTGSMDTATAVRLARAAEDEGADYISSIPPFYYKYTPEEIIEYYLNIMDAVKIPMIIYNFPDYSGIDISGEIGKRLFEDPRAAGIKHTSLNLFTLRSMKRKWPEKIILNGYDEIFLESIATGADGAIGSTYNVIPEVYITMKKYFLQGDMEKAGKLRDVSHRLIDLLSRYGVYQGLKFLLSLNGIDAGECRKPFLPLSSEGKEKLKEFQLEISEEEVISR
jgi:N-acetylneuraminate lyase